MKVDHDDITIPRRELRRLVQWAEYGVGLALGGTGEKTICAVIEKWALAINLPGSKHPAFGQYIAKETKP